MTIGEERQMTIGEERVRISFNPSSDSMVDQIKGKAAELIDLCESMKAGAPGEKVRCVAMAQTCIEDGAMWAVKAATAK